MRVPLTVNDFLERAELVYGDRIGVVDEPDQPSDAAEAPLDFARSQHDSIDAYASRLTSVCDLIFSDEVLRPSFNIHSLKPRR